MWAAPQVRAAGELTCRAAVGSELQPVCAASCKNACETAFEAYEEKNFRETGTFAWFWFCFHLVWFLH